MDYTNYYSEVTTIADKIRAGTYTVTKDRLDPYVEEESKKQEDGFLAQPNTAGDTVEAVPYNNEEIVMEYMLNLYGMYPEGPSNRAMYVTDLEGDVQAAREALADVESRGSGGYSAVGPLVRSGMYAGERAYGRYQVMESNIGPWTEEALGQRLTVQEFMNSPEAQDTVVEYRLNKAFEEHGTWEDAASVWFSGRPMAAAGNASDGFNTVPEYIAKFSRSFANYATPQGFMEAP